mgnify:CR=1 FL=1
MNTYKFIAIALLIGNVSFGQTLKDVAKRAFDGDYSCDTLCWDNCLSDNTINELKRYAKEHE